MPESYTGTEGTAAAAAGLDVMDGDEDRRDGWLAINKTRDYIVQRIAALLDTIWPVAKGGTGATTPAQARTNLGIPEIAPPNTAEGNKLPVYNVGGQLTSFPPTLGAHVATKAYVDGSVPPAPPQQLTDGGTFLRADGKNLGTTGDLFASGTAILGILSPVTQGWRQMYINGDGRVGTAASARRYKKEIQDHAYTLADLLAIRVRQYRLNAELYGSDAAPIEIGVIAEELVDAGLSEYVYFDEDDEPTSVHYERLALVAIGALQDLAVQHAELAARVDELVARNG